VLALTFWRKAQLLYYAAVPGASRGPSSKVYCVGSYEVVVSCWVFVVSSCIGELDVGGVELVEYSERERW
jgi:hypothetical protein